MMQTLLERPGQATSCEEKNARADLQARTVSSDRVQSVAQTQERARKFQEGMLSCIRSLRSIYFSIANITQQTTVADEP